MNLEKKDIVEFAGAVAIIASLVFVGVQLRQSQNIAVAEGYATIFSNQFEVGNSIKEHVNIWRRGTSGGELTEDESAIFAILVNQVNESKVMGYVYMGAIEDYEAAEFQVKEFAAFLYQNPGARKVWDNRESSLIKYRTLLSDDGTYNSSWTNRVHARLVILDREQPAFAKKPFVDW
ncbi:MAG: hypothetical protein IID58_11180 [Proteobacteria bacterium]|nr:hypothetical protein [Pseudomonadota bacterium]